jgi:putative redox protein
MTAPAGSALAASVHARCLAKYAVESTMRRHQLLVDEPVAAGGGDGGPSPVELVAAGLAACTAITLRMYAERKGWELGEVKIDCRAWTQDAGYRFERTIRFGAPLSEEQRVRLGEIAEKTPVTKLVRAGAPIATELR